MGAVTLRKFEEADIKNKIQWINNPDNNMYLHYDIPLEYDKTLSWYQNKNNAYRKDLIIEYENVSVGLIGLLNIDVQNSKAEFYISMGDTRYKNKGIATQASLILLDYAFCELKLHKIYLNTDGDNIIAHRLFEKIGFTKEGVFKDDMIRHGQYIDRIRYAIINNHGGMAK